ncbi:hypothetical protein [Sulfurimonas sp.]
MKIENPFESGHIRNYILFYASVIVIMILFFLATTLFHDVKKVEKKKFDINSSKVMLTKKTKQKEEPRFKLMQKAY